ncbi:MAG: hypothetical protein WBX03_03470 [Terriglobales bacterium]|jgi:hypothetical protein
MAITVLTGSRVASLSAPVRGTAGIGVVDGTEAAGAEAGDLAGAVGTGQVAMAEALTDTLATAIGADTAIAVELPAHPSVAAASVVAWALAVSAAAWVEAVSTVAADAGN